MSPDTGVSHQLAQARLLYGLSQDGLAARIRTAGSQRGTNVATTKKSVSEWEHGRVPDELTRDLIASVFSVSDDTRAGVPWPFWLPAPDLPELYAPWTAAGTVSVLGEVLRSGRMDRRRFVILSGVALTTLLHSWLTTEPDIAHAVSGDGRRVSAAMVDRIADQITDLQRADDQHGGGDLIIEAEAHLSLVTRLLGHATLTEVQRARLYGQAADLARMAGWMTFDNGRHAAAQRYFAAALRASHSAGDPLLGANVLAFAAVQEYSVGNPHDADAMIRTAQTAVRGRSTPAVDAMLAARQARALAKAGDAAACFRALNRATDLVGQPHDDDPPWAYWVLRPEIDMLAGSCMLDLGQPAAAQVKFTEADAAYGPGYVRTHALYLTRMATAQLQQQDVDEACATASQALGLLADINSARSSDTIRAFTKQLTPYRKSPAACTFLDQARSL
ncbi:MULTISPECIES: XRE family transcriptional regulator [unclassified Streptomyces]|uniref:XRE family transcriptional regulator n=1 Tax=unclassified Streptomyces TaxID=2593676 RepID=UPI002253313D|nr:MULTISPECIES: XRE family transcriptional regulator [unclassified Streptomyces]MCX4554319.1 XRE family transcriptional regulator [Streptomyces sp. NBC_01500]WSC25027.1 XRE family transcriptional regulator [Streptomyces sp. NBC_01766]